MSVEPKARTRARQRRRQREPQRPETCMQMFSEFRQSMIQTEDNANYCTINQLRSAHSSRASQKTIQLAPSPCTSILLVPFTCSNTHHHAPYSSPPPSRLPAYLGLVTATRDTTAVHSAAAAYLAFDQVAVAALLSASPRSGHALLGG